MSEPSESVPANLVSLLDSDEKILWQGRPSTKLFLLTRLDIFLIPASLVWAGMAIPGSFSEILQPGGLSALPVALLFLAAGIYVLIGRFFVSQLARKNTVYFVSNKRAFIATNGIGGRIDSKPLNASLAISLEPSEPGSISLGDAVPFMSGPRGFGIWTGNDGRFTFRKIPNAEKVYALIRSIQSGKT